MGAKRNATRNTGAFLASTLGAVLFHHFQVPSLYHTYKSYFSVQTFYILHFSLKLCLVFGPFPCGFAVAWLAGVLLIQNNFLGILGMLFGFLGR